MLPAIGYLGWMAAGSITSLLLGTQTGCKESGILSTSGELHTFDENKNPVDSLYIPAKYADLPNFYYGSSECPNVKYELFSDSYPYLVFESLSTPTYSIALFPEDNSSQEPCGSSNWIGTDNTLHLLLSINVSAEEDDGSTQSYCSTQDRLSDITLESIYGEACELEKDGACSFEGEQQDLYCTGLDGLAYYYRVDLALNLWRTDESAE